MLIVCLIKNYMNFIQKKNNWVKKIEEFTLEDVSQNLVRPCESSACFVPRNDLLNYRNSGQESLLKRKQLCLQWTVKNATGTRFSGPLAWDCKAFQRVFWTRNQFYFGRKMRLNLWIFTNLPFFFVCTIDSFKTNEPSVCILCSVWIKITRHTFFASLKVVLNDFCITQSCSKWQWELQNLDANFSDFISLKNMDHVATFSETFFRILKIFFMDILSSTISSKKWRNNFQFVQQITTTTTRTKNKISMWCVTKNYWRMG